MDEILRERVAVQSFAHQREVDLRGLVVRLVRFLPLVLAISVLGGAAGFAAAYINKLNFISSTTVYIEASANGGISNQAKSLAGLAGLELGAGTGRLPTLGIEMLGSRKHLTEFMRRHYDRSPEFRASVNMIGKLPPATKLPMSDDRLYGIIAKRVEVGDVSEDGVMKISVRSELPYFSYYVAANLVGDTNRTLRQKEISESKVNRSLLRREFVQAENLDLRRSITDLIAAQMEREMRARSRPEFVFTTIEPPYRAASDRGRKMVILTLLGLAGGLGLGLALIFVWHPVGHRPIGN